MENIGILTTIKNKQNPTHTKGADSARINLSERLSKSKKLQNSIRGAWINSCGNQMLCNGYFAIQYDYPVTGCVNIPQDITPPQIDKVITDAKDNNGTCIIKPKKQLIDACTQAIKLAKAQGTGPLMRISGKTITDTQVDIYFNPRLLRDIVNTLTNDVNGITVRVSNRYNAATNPIFIQGGNGCACLCTFKLLETIETSIYELK